MKRVAVQLISTGGFYGAERVLLDLAQHLAANQWESYVLALEGTGGPELVSRARAIGLPAMAFSDGSRVKIGTMARRLRKELARHPHVIVHSHGYKGDILLGALGVPRRLACLATCHTWYSETPKMRLLERLDKWMLRGFDHVVAVSDEIRADLLASGVSGKKIVRIDNGIDVPSPEPTARSTIRSEFGIGEDEFVVVQIGRLAASKRNVLLLQAIARLSPSIPVKVLLVGEGPEYSAVMETSRELGISARITMCGFRRDVSEFLAAADVLALTSNREGMPIILLEAMAIGCPIVATAVGAVPDLLRDRDTARLIPVEDSAALVQALAEVLKDRERSKLLAERAKSAFNTRFRKDLMGRRYLEIYERTWLARGWR